MDTIKDQYRMRKKKYSCRIGRSDWYFSPSHAQKEIFYVIFCKIKLHTPDCEDDEEIYVAKKKIELKLKTKLHNAHAACFANKNVF